MVGSVKCILFFNNFAREKWTVWPHGRFLHAVARERPPFSQLTGELSYFEKLFCAVLAAACYCRLACVKAVIKLFCPAARELSEPAGAEGAAGWGASGAILFIFPKYNTKKKCARAVCTTCFVSHARSPSHTCKERLFSVA